MNFLKKAAKLADKANPMNLIAKAGENLAEFSVKTVTDKDTRENFSFSNLIVDSATGVSTGVGDLGAETV